MRTFRVNDALSVTEIHLHKNDIGCFVFWCNAKIYLEFCENICTLAPQAEHQSLFFFSTLDRSLKCLNESWNSILQQHANINTNVDQYELILLWITTSMRTVQGKLYPKSSSNGWPFSFCVARIMDIQINYRTWENHIETKSNVRNGFALVNNIEASPHDIVGSSTLVSLTTRKKNFSCKRGKAVKPGGVFHLVRICYIN